MSSFYFTAAKVSKNDLYWPHKKPYQYQWRGHIDWWPTLKFLPASFRSNHCINGAFSRSEPALTVVWCTLRMLATSNIPYFQMFIHRKKLLLNNLLQACVASEFQHSLFCAQYRVIKYLRLLWHRLWINAILQWDLFS